MSYEALKLFALDEDLAVAEALADRLGVVLAPLERRVFEDGECKMRPLCHVQGTDVFVISTLFSRGKVSVHDRLCQLLFFVGALRDAGAARITILAPYLCYGRKDRKTKVFDPTTSQYVARMIESMRTDRILTIDVHNIAAFQNGFRIQTDHLEATDLLVKGFHMHQEGDQVAVFSPDLGGIKRAQRFRDGLARVLGRSVSFGLVYKERSGGQVTSGDLVGEVKDKDVIIIDDIIATGTTIQQAAAACLQQGARRVYGVATHALLLGEATHILMDSSFYRLIVTNTIAHSDLPRELRDKMHIVDISPLLAHAVTEWHGAVSRPMV